MFYIIWTENLRIIRVFSKFVPRMLKMKRTLFVWDLLNIYFCYSDRTSVFVTFEKAYQSRNNMKSLLILFSILKNVVVHHEYALHNVKLQTFMLLLFFFVKIETSIERLKKMVWQCYNDTRKSYEDAKGFLALFYYTVVI